MLDIAVISHLACELEVVAVRALAVLDQDLFTNTQWLDVVCGYETARFVNLMMDVRTFEAVATTKGPFRDSLRHYLSAKRFRAQEEDSKGSSLITRKDGE